MWILGVPFKMEQKRRTMERDALLSGYITEITKSELLLPGQSKPGEHSESPVPAWLELRGRNDSKSSGRMIWRYRDMIWERLHQF